MTENLTWENCPFDVLMMVFKKLDTTCLVQCFSVNKWWRDVADFYAQHHNAWKQIAQQEIPNKGLSFVTKCSSDLDWRDLYVNFNLWTKVRVADLNSKILLTNKDFTKSIFVYKGDLLSVNVYKDILIVVYGQENSIKYFKISNTLQEYKPMSEENQSTDDAELSNSISDDTKRMMKKLATCGTFKKYAIFDDSCFYILDSRSVLRRYLWDNRREAWLDQVLGRYYGCNRSIADIHVFDGEVMLLLKRGMVMRLDRKGRNFEKAYYIEYPPYSILNFLRMFRSKLEKSIERVAVLDVPQYNTGQSVMFDKLNAVVGVPKDKAFKVSRNKEGYMIVECPGLTYALQHGDVLFLGFENGNIDIYRPDKLLNFYKPELRYNLRCVENCPKDVAVVSMDVHETFESHYLFIATRSSLVKLEITYSKSVKDSVTLLMK